MKANNEKQCGLFSPVRELPVLHFRRQGISAGGEKHTRG